MSIEEKNKAVLRRWYDEMYTEKRFKELMPQLAGPMYIRHEREGTRTVTIEEYIEEMCKFTENVSFSNTEYNLIAETWWPGFVTGVKW